MGRGGARRRPHGARRERADGGGWALSGLLGYALTATLYANLDAADSSAAHFPPWQLGVAVAVALAAAGVGLLLTRFVPDPALEPTGDDGTDRIDLADGELAGWSRRTGSGALLAVGLVTLVAGVFVAALVSWRYGPVVFVIGLLALVFASAHVSVDRHGLTVAMGALSWPRVRVPLDAVETASSRRINAVADYGGWGYRIRHKRTGVVLRSGRRSWCAVPTAASSPSPWRTPRRQPRCSTHSSTGGREADRALPG